MKKAMFGFGAFALALAMSGLPAAAFANNDSEENDDAVVHLSAQAQEVDVHAKTSVRVEGLGEHEGQSGRIDATGSDDDFDLEDIADDQSFGDDEDEIHFDLEDDDEGPATSLDDLKQKIEVRKHQLEQEVASTSQNHQQIVEHANAVRVAVHSLLSSKELLGGIGPEVSKIAKEMNNSVATTTNAEAKIQSRSFFTRLFFGGDSATADIIAQEVARNQQHIDDLTKMLGQVNVSADIQVILRAQIAAIQEAQTRLQELAQKEQTQWGLFSWRF